MTMERPNRCVGIKCANGGSLDSSCKCVCAGRWSGTTCNACPDQPCNHARSKRSAVRNCECDCLPSHWGSECEYFVVASWSHVAPVGAATDAYIRFSWNVPPTRAEAIEHIRDGSFGTVSRFGDSSFGVVVVPPGMDGPERNGSIGFDLPTAHGQMIVRAEMHIWMDAAQAEPLVRDEWYFGVFVPRAYGPAEWIRCARQSASPAHLCCVLVQPANRTSHAIDALWQG